MGSRLRSVAIASAVAALFSASASAGEKAPAGKKYTKVELKVACLGVNECKGKGECGGGGHDCAGENACKGQGWIQLAAKDCKAKGGKVLDTTK